MNSPQVKSSLDHATQFQQKASDPTRSAWVSANAGSGKTFVLVNRIVRLMLEGAEPQNILCLTFTKAAAAEMSNRLFDRLSEWVAMDDAQLTHYIEMVAGRKPTENILKSARKLFARSLETPGGLKIQTIHGFCESLLQRFPIEAGLSPGFRVLEEAESRVLKDEARNSVLSRAMKDRCGPLGQALSKIVALAEGDRFDQTLDHILRGREKLVQNIDQKSLKEQPDILTSKISELRNIIQLEETDIIKIYDMSFLSDENFEKDKFTSLRDCLREGGKRDHNQAELLDIALNAKSANARVRYFDDFFMTKAGAKKSESYFISRKTKELNPDLASWALDRQEEYQGLVTELKKIGFYDANSALYLLADAIDATYRALKSHQGCLDFDDLVSYSCDLFKRVSGAWVLYKIDGGLDHILVDEAQDTSSAQWQIISAIAEEFFSGEGANQTERTVFAVGDEKQSIYSFQGAEPSQFDKMRDHFERRARSAQRRFEKVPLSVSFRSTARVLGFVDDVFKNPDAGQGLTHSGDIDNHLPTRHGQAGLIEVWDTLKPQETRDPDPWDAPLDWHNPESPSHQLAHKIARKIRSWLDNKTNLKTRGRPIEPGDILILVRKRKAFFEAMLRALKAHNIPVAGADRMALSEQIAVMDLVALGRLTLLPEDDLTLACVLKSPLIGLSEEELYELANGRDASLWRVLELKTPEIFQTLNAWCDLSRHKSVFDFYSFILNTAGGRQKFVGRLGEEANDPIDEFLSLALTYEQTGGTVLQDFLHRFSKSDITIKRDMEHGKNEVRLMTVHGAKGLEGNIVFLPETCTVPKAGSSGFTSLRSSNHGFELPVWGLGKRQHFEEISDALETDKQQAMAEYRRLLYVALTRARDRLYICGFDGRQSRDDQCWYNLVKAALVEQTPEDTDDDGDIYWRLEDQQDQEPLDNLHSNKENSEIAELPDWAREKMPDDEYPPRPLVPSRLEDMEDVDLQSHKGSSFAEQSVISPLMLDKQAPQARFKRGQFIHKLLQYLPDIAPDKRRVKAANYLKSAALEFDQEARQEMVDEVCSLLEGTEFKELFGPRSKAEVPISALISAEETGGRSLAINGQIDRLVVSDHEVMIVDYKTNRPPPQSEAEVAPLYMRQMAAYRLILQKIYPEHKIKCALLWTYELRLMPLSESHLEKALKGIAGT